MDVADLLYPSYITMQHCCVHELVRRRGDTNARTGSRVPSYVHACCAQRTRVRVHAYPQRRQMHGAHAFTSRHARPLRSLFSFPPLSLFLFIVVALSSCTLSARASIRSFGSILWSTIPTYCSALKDQFTRGIELLVLADEVNANLATRSGL